MPKQESNDNIPIHTVRHRRLKAAIWRNQTDKGVMYNVTLSRSYRDKATEKWHDSNSFGYDDLMNVAALLNEARSFISACKTREAKRGPAKKAAPDPR